MNLIHKTSHECAKSELDLFHTPETQAMILSGKWVDHHPISLMDGESPIEFKVSTAEEYNDISQTFLHIQAQIVDSSGAVITNQAVAPTNLFLHSLFSQVDISLNDVLVTSSVNTYAYRSMIETLLNYGEDAKRTHLQSELYYKDTPGQMDTIETDLTKSTNTGWIKRRELSLGKTIDMFGRIHGDIFFQDRF